MNEIFEEKKFMEKNEFSNAGETNIHIVNDKNLTFTKFRCEKITF